jgi:CRISPR system Cascade subunit CasD
MTVLLLRLAGPMQSWGVQSRFGVRDTGLEPSKSGVVGLLCAALGRPRADPVADLAALEMGVRVDREGRLMRDYHTAGGERRTGSVLGSVNGKPRPYGVAKANGNTPETVVSERFYLADADFLVALGGPHDLLAALAAAVAAPVWPLSLGRKAFVPGGPLTAPGGLLGDATVRGALETHPWCGRPGERRPDRLRVVLDIPPGQGEARPDLPVSFADRRFGLRHVLTDFIPTPPAGPEAACS